MQEITRQGVFYHQERILECSQIFGGTLDYHPPTNTKKSLETPYCSHLKINMYLFLPMKVGIVRIKKVHEYSFLPFSQLQKHVKYYLIRYFVVIAAILMNKLLNF